MTRTLVSEEVLHWNLLTGVFTPGKVFYVDSGGSNSNSGLLPSDPFATVTYAISKCTTSQGDVVQLLGNSPSSPTDAGLFPIVVDKNNITIRGLLSNGLLSDSGLASDGADEACFEINAHYVTIEDLYLGCQGTGGNTVSGIIDGHSSVAYWGFTLRRCMLGIQGSSKYGIAGKSGIGPYLLIEDCVFGRGKSTNWFTTAAIAIPDNATGGIIRNNYITGGTIGISIAGTAVDIRIIDNHIQMYSDGKGAGITIGSGSGSGIYVAGNHASFGSAADENVPYVDDNTADANTWGQNWAQEAVQFPTTSA